MITKIYRVKGTFVMGTLEANMVSTGTRFQSIQSRKSLLKTWKTQS